MKESFNKLGLCFRKDPAIYPLCGRTIRDRTNMAALELIQLKITQQQNVRFT